jgi:hypothetical protein
MQVDTAVHGRLWLKCFFFKNLPKFLNFFFSPVVENSKTLRLQETLQSSPAFRKNRKLWLLTISSQQYTVRRTPFLINFHCQSVFCNEHTIIDKQKGLKDKHMWPTI